MENLEKKEFLNSLDLTNDELETYVPDLLKGLWSLGSMPEYIVELITRNNLEKNKNIMDLGCGKGAVLITLAQQFDIKAFGVDIVPCFIEDAMFYADVYAVSDKVEFKTENILQTLKTSIKQDIVIYGYDSEILGDLYNALRALTNCIKEDGYILLEFMFADQPTEGILTDVEMKNTIKQAGYCILDRIDWNRETLKLINRKHTKIIKKNVKRLISQYPDKQELFREYLQKQIDECKELENDYICTTLLLRQNKYFIT